MVVDEHSRDREDLLLADGGEIGICRDDLHHILNNYRRRALIRHVDEFSEEEVFDLKAVSNEITSLERELSSSEDSPSRKTVYTTLRQHHMPVLEEDRILDFDSDSKEFRTEKNFDIIRYYVDDGFYAEETPVDGLERDKLHRILGNPRRRAVVRYMKEFPEEAYDLQQISDELASLEENIPRNEITKEDSKGCYSSMFQHLPLLDDHDIIDYDDEDHSFDSGESFDAVASYVGDSFYEPDQHITEERAFQENKEFQGFLRGFIEDLRFRFG